MTDVATKNWYIVHTYSGFEKKVAEFGVGFLSVLGTGNAPLRNNPVTLLLAESVTNMLRSRNSAQRYSALIRRAERSASSRRTAAISSGPRSAEPQSPGVIETMLIRCPFAASSASVPAHRISTSSGCA